MQVATRWDGAFYLDIARNGYGPVDIPFPKWPFFPLLPGLIQAFDEVANDKVAIFVFNQLLFLVALAGVYRLASRHGGRTVGALSVWALALFPASFVFSMTYPSAIFLAASVWAFVLVEDHHDLAAGLVAVGSALVRPNGLVLAVALVVAVWWSWRRVLAVAGPSVVAVARVVHLLRRPHRRPAGVPHHQVPLAGDHVRGALRRAREVVGAPARGARGRGAGGAGGAAEAPSALVAGVRRAVPHPVAAARHGRGGPVRERVLPALRRRRPDPRAVVDRGARYAVFAASTVGLVLFAFVAARYELVP